ncbi:MAG: hypothetical protein DMG39_06175 [Acidobacteria bacterium]|nr:MAG: hypothetical protein DMG39_06175 [Acidobacteriota bacterium]
MVRELQERCVSDEHNFDPKKFSDNLRDSIHDQIHRNIHDSANWRDEKQGTRRRPMVIGIDLRGRGRGGIVAGGILVLIGLAFLLDNLGIISISYLWRFWPMLVILAGVLNFLYRHRPWGTLLMLAGIVFQLNQLGITHFGWAQFWPMILIGLGLLVLWGSLEWGNKPILSSSREGDPRTTLNAAIFGGVELDLTEANMQANETTLAITTIFGGVDMRIPPTWQVAFRGAPIFGGIEDKTRTARVADPTNSNLKTLVITGAVIFGGLKIKN